MVTFTDPVTMRVPESKLMPSAMVVTRGTEGPAGMIRTHAGSATGWPSHTISTATRPGGAGGTPPPPRRRGEGLAKPHHFHRHQAGARTFGQGNIDLRDAVLFRLTDVHEAARAAIGSDGHVVQIGFVGQPFHPQGERRQGAAHRRRGFSGERVADPADDRTARDPPSSQGRAPSRRTLAAGDPHVLRPDLLHHQQLHVLVARKLRDLVRGDTYAVPGVVLFGVRGQPVYLAA